MKRVLFLWEAAVGKSRLGFTVEKTWAGRVTNSPSSVLGVLASLPWGWFTQWQSLSALPPASCSIAAGIISSNLYWWFMKIALSFLFQENLSWKCLAFWTALCMTCHFQLVQWYLYPQARRGEWERKEKGGNQKYTSSMDYMPLCTLKREREKSTV